MKVIQTEYKGYLFRSRLEASATSVSMQDKKKEQKKEERTTNNLE